MAFQLSRSLGSETNEDFCLSPELTCKLTRSQVVLLVPLCFSGYYVPIPMCLLKDTSFYIPLGRKVKVTVTSNSLRPHRLYSPWNSPGQNTGVGSHSLLQGHLLNPGTEPRSPTLQADSLPSEPPGKTQRIPY